MSCCLCACSLCCNYSACPKPHTVNRDSPDARRVLCEVVLDALLGAAILFWPGGKSKAPQFCIRLP